MDVFEAIKTRRSIRRYKPDPVGDEDVKKVLDAAHWAPSWANTHCCRFIVVRDAGIKSRVAATLTKVQVGDDWVKNAAAEAIIQAPLLVVACGQKGLAGYNRDGTPAAGRDEWLLFDVALAMQNLALAARGLGLGTVIVGAFDADKAAKLLDVPENSRVVTMTPLGYPDHTGQVPPRQELNDIIYTDKYGQK